MSDEVSVTDLIGTLEDTNEYGDLKRMTPAQAEPIRETSQISQQRANLSAAYEVAKGNVAEWGPVVSKQQKERTITFEDKTADVTFDKFEPQKTQLGSEIDEILKAEKLTRGAQQTLEDEALSHLTEEEIRQKVEQLSRLRQLQFYNEQKAKRWKKIKSKAFRRLHKKDMRDLTLEELAEVDPEAFEARLQKLEAERAKERATLRHKNTSQWVRRVLARGLKAASADVKASYEEQVRRGEELARKIKGYDRGAGNDESDDEELENPIQKDEKLKSIFDMQFMKDAERMKEQKIEEIKRALAEENEVAEASGLVTVRSNRNEIIKKKEEPKPVQKEEKPAEKQEAEKPAEEVKEVEEPKEEKGEQNPWLNRKKKSSRRFVSATSFHQLTDSDLAKAAEKINFAKKEEQKEILADAFGLQEEFEKEKEATALKESEAGLTPMSDLHKPGWGSWVGPGAKPSEGALRRQRRIEEERDQIRKAALQERKDSQMPHVMIHEGVDPAVEKYSMDLPKIYTNPKQLKAQLAFPLMPEVNSAEGFNQLITPNMIAEAGKIIDPIRFTKMMRMKEKIHKRNVQRKPLESAKALRE